MEEENWPKCEGCKNKPTPTKESDVITQTASFLLFNLRRYENCNGKTKKLEIDIIADEKISVQCLDDDGNMTEGSFQC